jgi:hypothetical protein
MASQLGIAKETGRNQLKSVFIKTGVHRQAEPLRCSLLLVCLIRLDAWVEIRNAAPKFSGDWSLGAAVQLLYHEKSRHLIFSAFGNKAARRNMIAWQLRLGV